MALVDYGSSSDDEEGHALQKSASPSKKQKKLPSLPLTFDTAPKDDPSLHQGRKRSRPYVDGEYNTHVYLSLSIPLRLSKILETIIAKLPPSPNPIHALLPSLHISLTRPVPLRRHQIQPFKDELASRLGQICTFKLSLTGSVKAYYNEVTGGGSNRVFLALRVGAGVSELKKIVDVVLDPTLKKIHLPTYHDNPEFHTSFAWTLFSTKTNDQDTSRGNLSAFGDRSEETPGLPFGEEDLDRVNSIFESEVLKAQPAGGWTISSVEVKVAKEIATIPLKLA
ncbi:hypothetical protein CNC01375 [Cryptococcus deneoformans JEC21]|uniref:U6 snRNA phosphodiesterase 1 n=1 Tax=Cryptococcus deneoformans (strain JEC21 / ATCC MYA-565) TaxID=214684 RepID=A0A0S2LIS0_CRYD1|nr:hypothetical protein CNC01375 [Cryptococcus neoformans var. neoformans JEC21]ALO60446.1 hypothetical protein CNC01375 [Cryptococcus neoformans var. neoformans JEC21]